MNKSEDFSSYIMMVTPPRSQTLQEIVFNSAWPEGTYTSFNETDDVFCNRKNLVQCVEYLEKELQMLGYSSLHNGNSVFDVTRLVNVAHSLLKKHQQSSRHREDLENRLHRSASDLDHIHNGHKKLKHVNKALQDELAKQQETERKHKIEIAGLQNKLKTHIEEVRRLKALLLSNENQYKHEIRKKELQLLSLKERANQLVSEKSRVHASMEISRCLQQADGKRSKWRTEASSNRNEEELYGSVISSFEKKCCCLMAENTKLKDIIADILQELTHLCQECGDTPGDIKLVQDQLQLPIEHAFESISACVRGNCVTLRQHLGKQGQSVIPLKESAHMEISSSQLEGLARDLEVCHTTIDRQKSIIEAFKMEDGSISAGLSVLEEQEALSKERESLYKMQVKVERDKQTITEAAINLTREKKAFEEYKKKCLTSYSIGGGMPENPDSDELSNSHTKTRQRTTPAATLNSRISHMNYVKVAASLKEYIKSSSEFDP